ncbi:hypothetical protein SAMN04515674_101442 [Pseudarcicella hirudinis]|uniref:Uncharacterized protein n=1 Tax=Pseudarcicella hirudinis TaxID=1079859 RepID=A0A1I5MTJ4_9BACT|nr:hypothetical protein [Pseudarcicella hirudinis]SFP12878.1 hypothetical protein SAMN04515674_101442 [Pseudarcicella hirudinis]
MKTLKFYVELGNDDIPGELFTFEPPEEVLSKVCYSWQYNSKRIGEKNDLHLDATVIMAKRVMNPNFGGGCGGDSICVVTGLALNCSDLELYKRCISEVVNLVYNEIGGISPVVIFDEVYYVHYFPKSPTL